MASTAAAAACCGWWLDCWASAVIPGKALTTADLLKLDELNTRANETLWILHLK
jgi:hypothetical protein